ncbi:PilJ/NarX-like methyl-accepting chemotaxis transducer [Litoreibacter ponti]|uniref:histidine kinase n=1 Tax=Litoreibacter ponti TaxID=1510457 RepID=A0A2T6BDN1_9RHOB|nr:ATP-binding protein [Litoreibacter ponti]PTX54179.1 PilJ/NarX-like methyl-accepting chemotaxis transducer [Litoreibacter ponti]
MTSERSAHMSLRRIFLMYLAALAVLFTSVTASLFLTDRVTKQVEVDASEINISGRQRMLSQRIIYLSQDLLTSDGADTENTRMALRTAIEELEAAIDLFEASHIALSTRSDLDAARVELYFASIDGATPLNARVKDYLVQARKIVDGNDTAQSLQRLKEIERGGLLADLDKVVAATEAASLQRLNTMRDLGWYSLIIALAIIVVEILLVFLPGHRLIQATLDTLRARNVQLSDAHKSLQAKTQSLLAKNEQIASDRKRLEDAWQESEALRREQSDFTYAVSHDLKSPANTMHLLLNEMSLEHAPKMDEDGNQLLEMALGTVKRMEMQIEDLLQYCWATNPQSEPETLDLNECVSDVLVEFNDEISQRDARIDVEPLPQFFGHPMQIKVLLKNLVQNALKFQLDGAQPQITIGVNDLGPSGVIELWVRDNGIGISPENHSKIFGLFQRLHVRESYPGTGLGLTTCHRIARNHGGNIMVESEEGAGSCFIATLRPAALRPSTIELDDELSITRSAA